MFQAWLRDFNELFHFILEGLLFRRLFPPLKYERPEAQRSQVTSPSLQRILVVTPEYKSRLLGFRGHTLTTNSCHLPVKNTHKSHWPIILCRFLSGLVPQLYYPQQINWIAFLLFLFLLKIICYTSIKIYFIWSQFTNIFYWLS